jgi:cysteine desulfurase
MCVMTYLDYSASTPTSLTVLEHMHRIEREYFANINAKHAFALRSKEVVLSYISKMASLLNIPSESLVFTSGATESNNMILFGLAKSYPHKRHIISTSLEHHSVISPLGELQKLGYELDFIPYLHGKLDFEALKKLIREDTLCVSVIAVESETGLVHPLKDIKAICDDYGVPLHSDMTQAVGKIPVDFNSVTYASFSSHKIYGPKGIGACVLMKDDIRPLIYGGRSLSKLRSGTPPNALIVGFAQAVIEALENLEVRISIVTRLRNQLTQKCDNLKIVHVNTPHVGVPHICNLSFMHHDRHELVDQFSNHGFYVSASSACSGQENVSKAVLTVSENMDCATSSLRVSLSHLTSESDIDSFVQVIKKVIQ